MKKLAVIAQIADPRKGSEFAAGWCFLREIIFDPRIDSAFNTEVFIAEHEGNTEVIEEYCQRQGCRATVTFLPQVLPKLHKYLGRLMRLCWQFKVFLKLRRGEYDYIHQISPASIVYLNPIFLYSNKAKKIVGPMRIDYKASISTPYWHDHSVFTRQVEIWAKEFLEAIVLAYHRSCVRMNTGLYFSPLGSVRSPSNFLYCRETAFVDMFSVSKADPNTKVVIWSGLGDIHRKNESLAKKIVSAALESTKLKDVTFLMIGSEKNKIVSSRVLYVDRLERTDLLGQLSSGAVYLCTSTLEINSVLAEETLASGGSVVAGALPGFKFRPDSAGVHLVSKYNEVTHWVCAIENALSYCGGNSDWLKQRREKKEEVVSAILSLLKNDNSFGRG